MKRAKLHKIMLDVAGQLEQMEKETLNVFQAELLIKLVKRLRRAVLKDRPPLEDPATGRVPDAWSTNRGDVVLEGPRSEAEWVTKDGKVIPVSELADSHLLNIQRMQARNARDYLRAMSFPWPPDNDMPDVMFDRMLEAAERRGQVISDEVRRRGLTPLEIGDAPRTGAPCSIE